MTLIFLRYEGLKKIVCDSSHRHFIYIPTVTSQMTNYKIEICLQEEHT